jgi:flagella basal body P-ring formation protein FlgA
MNNNLIPFCSYNTGTLITCPEEGNIYVTASLANISGSFGVITVGSNQVLQPNIPIKFNTNISGAARSIFYYLGE